MSNPLVSSGHMYPTDGANNLTAQYPITFGCDPSETSSRVCQPPMYGQGWDDWCQAMLPLNSRIRRRPPPPSFRGQAVAQHQDATANLSISTSITLISKSWQLESQFCFLIENFQVRFNSQEIGQRNLLNIEQVALNVGPTSTSAILGLITAQDQSPTVREVSITRYSNARQIAGTIGFGWPGAVTTAFNASMGTTSMRPVEYVGVNLNDVHIGIHRGNQFYWNYPVNKWMKESGNFANHKGTITYPSNSPPDTIQVKASIVCGIPKLQSTLSRFRGFIDASTFLKDGKSKFPCRQVRFALKTDLNHDDQGLFNSPSEGECGFPIDLGSYTFTNDGGISILDVTRQSEIVARFNNPRNGIPTSTDADRSIARQAPGTFIATERSVGEPVRNAEASIRFDWT